MSISISSLRISCAFFSFLLVSKSRQEHQLSDHSLSCWKITLRYHKLMVLMKPGWNSSYACSPGPGWWAGPWWATWKPKARPGSRLKLLFGVRLAGFPLRTASLRTFTPREGSALRQAKTGPIQEQVSEKQKSVPPHLRLLETPCHLLEIRATCCLGWKERGICFLSLPVGCPGLNLPGVPTLYSSPGHSRSKKKVGWSILEAGIHPPACLEGKVNQQAGGTLRPNAKSVLWKLNIS